MAKFYISDLHLGHANVIKFDNRPFADVDEMEAEIIRRWNKAVTPGDTVYVLGDFIWRKGGDWEKTLPQLNGQIILIRGNHDPRQFTPKVRKMLAGVYDYHEIKDEGRKVILCHYPILFYNKSYLDSTYMLCGHVHTTGENELLEVYSEELKIVRDSRWHLNRGQIINVGCMMPWMDYTPRTLPEIIEKRNIWLEENAVFGKEMGVL